MQDLSLLDLYACAGQPASWPGMLDRLATHTGACSAVIQCFRPAADGPQIVWQLQDNQTVQAPMPASAIAAGAANPRFDRHRLARALGRVVGDDDLFDAHEPARGQLRQALMALGLGDFLGALVELPDGSLLGIALHRSAQATQRFSADDAQRLADIAPHVAQACTLSHALLTAQAERDRLRQQADLMRCGLLLCDGKGRISWMNRFARDLLAARPDMLRLDGDALRPSAPGGMHAWRAALARAAHDPDGGTHYLRLGTSAGGPAQPAMLAALRAPKPGCADTVVVAITDTASALGVSGQAWSKLFDLTPAEGCLVESLVGGHTLAAHAAGRHITVGTARNQLKQVLAKTGASRQSDLVRLALASAAAQLIGSGDPGDMVQ